MKRTTLVVLIIIVAAVAVGLGYLSISPVQAPAKPPTTTSTTTHTTTTTTTPTLKALKIGYLMMNPITDGGFGTVGYESLLSIRDEFGAEIVGVSEMVGVPDAEKVMRDYIGNGANLIIAHTSAFLDSVEKVAAEFPEVTFISLAEKEPINSNVGVIWGYDWEATYLNGVLAGLMTKTNKIGVVAGLSIPNQRAQWNGFKAGVESVNSAAEVSIVFAGSFTDPAKGKEIALSLIDWGADIIQASANPTGIGAIDACKETETYFMSSLIDMRVLSPSLELSSTINKYYESYEIACKAVQEGTWGGTTLRQRLANGLVGLAPYGVMESVIPKVIRDKVAQVKEDIIAGTIVVEADTS